MSEREPGSLFTFPPRIDPDAAAITVDEEREGSKSVIEFPRLAYQELPLNVLNDVLAMNCFGEVRSDSRQVFFTYDQTGAIQRLYYYRDDAWRWREFRRGRNTPDSGVLLRFKTVWAEQNFLRAVQQAFIEKSSKALSLYLDELMEEPERVPVADRY